MITHNRTAFFNRQATEQAEICFLETDFKPNTRVCTCISYVGTILKYSSVVLGGLTAEHFISGIGKPSNEATETAQGLRQT